MNEGKTRKRSFYFKIMRAYSGKMRNDEVFCQLERGQFLCAAARASVSCAVGGGLLAFVSVDSGEALGSPHAVDRQRNEGKKDDGKEILTD